MKYNTTLLLVILFFSIKLSFSQGDSTIIPKFGVQRTDIEFKLPNKYNYVANIDLQVLDKNKSKEFYNTQNDMLYNDFFTSVVNAKVSWNKKENQDKTYQTIIPPLKPNRFYRLKISYYTSESILAMFLMMHDEKNTNWHTAKTEWMKLLSRISRKNVFIDNGETYDAPITYTPTILQLNSFKNKIEPLDFSILDIKESDYIAGIDDSKEKEKKKEELKSKKAAFILKLETYAKQEFEVLNFVENQNTYSQDDLVGFCKWILEDRENFTEDDLEYFSMTLVDALDYVGIYNFYEKYLLGAFNDQSIETGQLKEFITEAIETEKASYTSDQYLPNYLSNFETAVINAQLSIPTYSTSFSTAYKLSLIPDFGYVAYTNNNVNTPSGGNLFLGINISLSPSNKNVPLQISDLSIKQRLAIHTGVTIGSIAEDNVRDNFFGNYSLLLGGGYKVLTQGTRVNIGGLFYNKIDAINGSKSLAIQPYIGLSIDLEIKKWLQTVFPNLKI